MKWMGLILGIGACVLCLTGCCSSEAVTPKADGIVRFAVLTDVQYAEQPARIGRHYSRAKLLAEEVVKQCNLRDDLDFMVHLGDVIDTGIDNFAPMVTVFAQSKTPVFHVMGNHDFSIPNERKPEVHRILGMPAPYYKKECGEWILLFMDSNEISSYAHPVGSPKHAEAMAIIRRDYPGFPSYEGGFGKTQMAWMESEIQQAEKMGRRVILCCHAPLSRTPRKESAAIDSPEVLSILKKYPKTVRLTLSGHYHRGRFVEIDGIPHLTLRGQVEAAVPAYSIVELSDSAITIHPIGEQKAYHWNY